jgi:hypothetical protein
MRALGPGSVSSFLKIILDVVFAALWIGVIVFAVITLCSLLLSFNPDLLPNIRLNGELEGQSIRTTAVNELTRNGPSITSGLFAAGLYLAGLLAIVGSLRRIFTTLTAGDPFHPDNVARLRLIGLMLAGLELGRYIFWMISAWLLPGVNHVEPKPSLTAWFSVLVVFVLAEVFREGARLRREAELTI